jgi:hypothetical protein
MNIWWELSHEISQEKGFAAMIGDVPAVTEVNTSDVSYTLFVPMTFWFCRNNGLALPLIA